MTKKNKNLKDGSFTKKELKLYENLSEKEIEIILQFQERLPILQRENDSWINGRNLHEQLKVGRDYSNWMKEQLDELDVEEGKEFTPSKAKTSKQGGRPKIEYSLTVETAKEIAMIAGAKGGRTNPELKELSKITRKYFIYIEKAFKERQAWNEDREGSISLCKELKGALIKNKSSIVPTLPQWSRGNLFVAEFSMLNDIIIEMSATEYRELKGLKKSTPIRNTFDEKQLECVKELEKYDADLIAVQGMFDMPKRREVLTKKFKSINKKAN